MRRAPYKINGLPLQRRSFSGRFAAVAEYFFTDNYLTPDVTRALKKAAEFGANSGETRGIVIVNGLDDLKGNTNLRTVLGRDNADRLASPYEVGQPRPEVTISGITYVGISERNLSSVTAQPAIALLWVPNENILEHVEDWADTKCIIYIGQRASTGRKIEKEWFAQHKPIELTDG